MEMTLVAEVAEAAILGRVVEVETEEMVGGEVVVVEAEEVEDMQRIRDGKMTMATEDTADAAVATVAVEEATVEDMAEAEVEDMVEVGGMLVATPWVSLATKSQIVGLSRSSSTPMMSKALGSTLTK